MQDVIMLVEDEESDVFLFERALKKTGCEARLVICADGKQAMDYLAGAGPYADRTAHPLPRLVLLDLRLPHFSGFDVLRWIRQQPHLSAMVVILSSSESNDDIGAAYRLGVNSYLVKPGHPGGLDCMVRAVVDYWLQYNRTSPLD